MLRINGEAVEFLCEPRQSLLEVLRDTLHMTGAKEGCNNGNCGACNVLLDGRLVNSCLVMAAEVEGRSVTTIEGIATPQGQYGSFTTRVMLPALSPEFAAQVRASLAPTPLPPAR